MALDRYSYPFTAIVGQDEMKLALVLNAINPTIGGVLIRGEKGTGKSTAVRALARLLPEQKVVEGCHFGPTRRTPKIGVWTAANEQHRARSRQPRAACAWLSSRSTRLRTAWWARSTSRLH